MNLNLINLQKSLARKKLDFLLIDSLANRYYLTGFTGSAGVVLVPSQGATLLLVDSRYSLQAKRQTSDLKVIEFANFFKENLVEFAKMHGGARIGFESIEISHDKLQKLKKFGRGLRWLPTKGLVEELREVKTADEVKKVKKALKISDTAFEEVKKLIKPGKTEKEIAFRLEVILKELGADKSAWEPMIIASGKNSALPHHGHSKTKIKKGDMIQLDFGCVLTGYHTDTSRVVFVGTPNRRQVEIYDLVLRAQMLGISLVKDGVETGWVDQQVKEWLRPQTTGVFKHGVGHGGGLEIHEKPTLYVGNKEKLKSGQVITIEPGIYLEGWGGVRLEDMVLVTEDGVELLTKAPKALEKIII